MTNIHIKKISAQDIEKLCDGNKYILFSFTDFKIYLI